MGLRSCVSPAGVQATRAIGRGEQILCNYGYAMDSMNPQWYLEVYQAEVGPLPTPKEEGTEDGEAAETEVDVEEEEEDEE